MKIGVVSDTHSKTLPDQMIKDFSGVDLILHLGDHCDISVLDALSQLKETRSVCGNMEDEEVFHKLPQKEIIEVENCRIGMCHGEGPPKKVLENVQRTFEKEKLDIVLFGHSHQPFKEMVKGVLYFNPGSPTDTIFAPYLSYGILEIKEGKVIDAQIIKVET